MERKKEITLEDEIIEEAAMKRLLGYVLEILEAKRKWEIDHPDASPDDFYRLHMKSKSGEENR